MAKRAKHLQSEFTEIEGVCRFKGPIPTNLRFTCMYLFEIDNISVAFDAGINFPDFSQKFFTSVKKLPDYCIVSHSHPDHIGLIKKLKQKNPNMKLLMSELTHDIIEWHTNPESTKAIQDNLFYKAIVNCISCKTCNFVCTASRAFGNVYASKYGLGALAIIKDYIHNGIEAAVEDGLFLCTGCENCSNWCPAGVDLAEIIRQLKKEATEKGLCPPSLREYKDKIFRDKNPFI